MSSPLLSAQDIACERSEATLFEEPGFELGAGEVPLVRGGNGRGRIRILGEPLTRFDVHGVELVEGLIRARVLAEGTAIMTPSIAVARRPHAQVGFGRGLVGAIHESACCAF